MVDYKQSCLRCFPMDVSCTSWESLIFNLLQNAEWKSMFGSNTSEVSPSSSPKTKAPTKAELQRQPSAQTGSVSSSTGSLVTVSQISSSVSSKSGPVLPDRQNKQGR